MKRKLETWKRKLQFCTPGGLLIAACAALGLTTLAQGGDPCNDPDAIITVEILTDNFGNETTWEVVEQGVGVIASGGPYPNTTLITVDVPVCSTSCYDFTIFDAFGDGICCGYGKGFYNVFYEGGLVCSGGTFKFEETCPNIGASCGGGDGCNDPDIVLTVEILTDNFGNETTFEVVEEGVGVILSGGPFPNNTLIIEEVDICSDKCYNFTIFDAFGDGICCGYGNGFYNIFVDGALVCSGGEFEDEETCFDLNGLGDCEGPPPPPENDNCEDATPLEVPSSVSGSTFNASPDEPPAFFCGTSVGAPGVWYSVIGTGTTMTATTCTDFFGYDTKLSVFCGDCSDGLTCVGGNDDNCSGGGSSLLSTVEWCSQAGAEYLILVHGFAGQVGDFDLEVSEDGVGCAADVLCLPQGACCFDDGSCLVTTEDDCAAQGGEYQGDDTQCFNPAGNPEVTVSNPNLDIPDNDPVGVSDTIVIPDADGVTIGDVDVDVVINHTWIGDLVITLEHNATVVTLWDRACSLENDMDVIFDDEGNPLFCAEPTTGNITPLSADGDALSLFDGQSSAGAWTITVTDNAGFDLGTLLQWSLHLDEGVPKCEVPPTGASLDIKPGSCPNSFNRNSNGVLPVALVGTDDFDVTEVDISSILLARTDGGGGSIAPHEGPPGPHSVFEDVATPFEGEEQCDCHEFEGDGVLDLSLKFKSSDLVDALGLDDLKAGELVSLTLTGSLLDGTPFEAADCIQIVPPGELPGMAMGSNAPGVFIDVTPLDETLDGGGFVDFKRTYLLGTIVTITAPQTHPGWVFVGWDFDDGGLSSFTVTRQGGFGLQPDDRTIEIIVLDEFSLKAIYRPTMYLP